jgi:sulfotransferase
VTEKTIHFISGLPRSGSTLLCNILNQNPRFHATATSGILEIILAIRNQWENVDTFRASPNKVGKDLVLKGILPNYYESVERPVVFDKSRGWGAYTELAEHILGRKVKMLCPVRPIVEVLASFEKLYRSQAHEWQFPQEKSHFYEWQTKEGRANIWMRNDQPVGIAYNRLKDAVDRGYGDRMLLIEFEHLTTHPEVTLRSIYNFLGEEYFDHDFNNVEQVTQENDDLHGIPGLHTIRPVVKPVHVDAKAIIGQEAFDKFSNAEFWRK